MAVWIRRWAMMFAVLTLLKVGALAYTPPEDFGEQTLEEVVTAYRESRGLNEQNFSLSYYNTVTEEAYAYNDTKFMVAASTYKLPLNMYYYEMEADGQIASDSFIPNTGCTLAVCHEQSLVWSNNDVSIAMLYNLGSFRTYKDCMRKYFSITDEEIDYIYYVDNQYCTRMMMDALKYLYDNQERFDQMLSYMKQAQPEQWFRAYVRDVEIAHKYGWFEGAVNDVGIIYTEQPFLLAVYTQDVGDAIVGEVAALLTAYTQWQTPEPEPVPEPEPEPEPKPGMKLEVEMTPVTVPEPEPVPVPEPEPVIEQEGEADPFAWWMAVVALAVFLLGGGLTLVIFRISRVHGKYEKRAEERIKPK